MADSCCGRCGKTYPSVCLEFVPNGETRWWRVDARPKSPGGARVGWEEWRRVGRPDGERLCYRCRGVADPRDTIQAPIARRAADAWADAVRDNPALARFAPRRR